MSFYYVLCSVGSVRNTKDRKTKFLTSSSLQSNWEMNQGLHCGVLSVDVDISRCRHCLSTREGLLRPTRGSEKASWMRRPLT